jgi:glutathione S-transferase
MDLKLYYTPGACSLAAHIALQEAGASFEPIRIDLAAGQQRSAEYLVVNPRGRVPTLVVDGVAIDETIAILIHIRSRHGGEAQERWVGDHCSALRRH